MSEATPIYRDRLWQSVAAAAIVFTVGAVGGTLVIGEMEAPTHADQLQRASIIVNIIYTLLTGLLVLGAIVGLRVTARAAGAQAGATARAATEQVSAIQAVWNAQKEENIRQIRERRVSHLALVKFEIMRLERVRHHMVQVCAKGSMAKDVERHECGRLFGNLAAISEPRAELFTADMLVDAEPKLALLIGAFQEVWATERRIIEQTVTRIQSTSSVKPFNYILPRLKETAQSRATLLGGLDVCLREHGLEPVPREQPPLPTIQP